MTPHVMQGSLAEAFVQTGMDVRQAGALVSAIICQARPIARAADKLSGAEHSSSPVSRWLRADHPNRVNLILESLGRKERL